jgi:hypothetical protein
MLLLGEIDRVRNPPIGFLSGVQLFLKGRSESFHFLPEMVLIVVADAREGGDAIENGLRYERRC